MLFLGVVEDSDGIVVERKELLEIVDSNGYSPLNVASRNWLPDLIEALLKYGANPFAHDLLGNNSLHFVAEG